ncbi:uncharacterized protein [Drosophila bipectinata]|uniref:uncharacterized protein isoform X1 n=2 Tax=Drosophila bipectinata TaxID=42026 RepID=UPI0038B30C81
MRVLLGAGTCFKICRFRVRWYSKNKSYVPTKELCEMMRRAIEARARKGTVPPRSRPMQVKNPETPALETVCRALKSSNFKSTGSPSHAGGDGDHGLDSRHQTSKHNSGSIRPISDQDTDPEMEQILDRTKPLDPTLFNCKDCHRISPNATTTFGGELFSKKSSGNRSMDEQFLNSETPHPLRTPKTPVENPLSASSKFLDPDHSSLPSKLSASGLKDFSKAPPAKSAAFPLGTHLRKGGKDVSKNEKPKWDSFQMPPQIISELSEETPTATFKLEDKVSDLQLTSKITEPTNGSVLKDPSKQAQHNKESVKAPPSPETNKHADLDRKSKAKTSGKPSPTSESIKQPSSSYAMPQANAFPRGRNPCIDGPRTKAAGECEETVKEDPCTEIQESPEEVCEDDPPKVEDESCDKLDKEEVCQLLSKLEKNEIRALLNIIKDKGRSDGPHGNYSVTKNKPVKKSESIQIKKPLKADLAQKRDKKTASKAPVKDTTKSVLSAKPEESFKSQYKHGELPSAPPSFSMPLADAFPRGRNPCRDGPRTAGKCEETEKQDPCKKIKKVKDDCQKPKNKPTCSELQSKEIRDLLSKLEEKLSCGLLDKHSPNMGTYELSPANAAKDQTPQVLKLENTSNAPISQILESPKISVKVEVSLKSDELSKTVGHAKTMDDLTKDTEFIYATSSLLNDTANTNNAKNLAENKTQPSHQSNSIKTKKVADVTKPAIQPKRKQEDDQPPPPPSDCMPLYGAFLRGRSPCRNGKRDMPAVEPLEKPQDKVEDCERFNSLQKEIRTLRKLLEDERSKTNKSKEPLNTILPIEGQEEPKCQNVTKDASVFNTKDYVNTQHSEGLLEVPVNDKSGIYNVEKSVNFENKFNVAAEADPSARPKAHQETASKLKPKPNSQRLTEYALPRFDAFPSGRNPCRDGPRESAIEEDCKEVEDNEDNDEHCDNSKTDESQGSCALETETEKISKSSKNMEQTFQSEAPKMTASKLPQPKEKLKEVFPCPKKSREQAKIATNTQRDTKEKHLETRGKSVENMSAPVSVAEEQKSKTSEKQESQKIRESEAPSAKQKTPTCSKICSFEVSICKNDDSERPKIKTFPVASLSKTLKGYLASIKPLLTAKEYEKEVEVTKEFEENEGADLQGLLKDAAKDTCNWLTPRWTTAAYLRYQAPVTVFSSPGMSFPIQKFKSEAEFLTFTAKVIHGVVEFKKIVDANKIPTTKLGSQYLDNSQFGKIFGTVRTPGRFCDKIEQHRDSKYVVVVHKNNYYKLPVYTADGKTLHVHILRDQLEGIINCPVAKGEPFGLLTHDNRGNWAEGYSCLCAPPENDYSVKTIEESLFVVCLDEFVAIPKGRMHVVQAHQLLHGGGMQKNSANRWMDKTLQLIVNPNGMAGFCYEHSAADCQPLASLMDFINQKLPEPNYGCESCDIDEPITVNCLAFQPLDDCVNLWLCEAKRNIQKIVNKLQLEIFHFDCHGKDFISSQGLCVDSYIQMALQLAYYSMHATLPAQYESAHLRIFAEGRTETIRSTCAESKAFVQLMTSPDATHKQRMGALRNALDAHQKLTLAAINGKGIDRHLFGLQQMAMENELPLPEFFHSKGFVRSVTFELFTSNVATENDSFMVFGPLVAQGYGCSYNPQEGKIVFSISAWKSNPNVDARRFGHAIKMSLESMREVIILTGGNRSGENCGNCPEIQFHK